MSYLTVFVEFFRFVKRYRERQEALRIAQATERHAERVHQLQLVETLFSKLIEHSKAQNEPLMEIAKAQQNMAETFSGWMKSFAIPEGQLQPLAPIAPQDEGWEFDDVLEGLDPKELAKNLPPEFSLAFQLDEMEQESDE